MRAEQGSNHKSLQTQTYTITFTPMRGSTPNRRDNSHSTKAKNVQALSGHTQLTQEIALFDASLHTSSITVVYIFFLCNLQKFSLKTSC